MEKPINESNNTIKEAKEQNFEGEEGNRNIQDKNKQRPADQILLGKENKLMNMESDEHEPVAKYIFEIPSTSSKEREAPMESSSVHVPFLTESITQTEKDPELTIYDQLKTYQKNALLGIAEIFRGQNDFGDSILEYGGAAKALEFLEDGLKLYYLPRPVAFIQPLKLQHSSDFPANNMHINPFYNSVHEPTLPLVSPILHLPPNSIQQFPVRPVFYAMQPHSLNTNSNIFYNGLPVPTPLPNSQFLTGVPLQYPPEMAFDQPINQIQPNSGNGNIQSIMSLPLPTPQLPSDLSQQFQLQMQNNAISSNNLNINPNLNYNG